MDAYKGSPIERLLSTLEVDPHILSSSEWGTLYLDIERIGNKCQGIDTGIFSGKMAEGCLVDSKYICTYNKHI